MTDLQTHDAQRDKGRMCPHCHYPMLPLRGFEGRSSRDALGYGKEYKPSFEFWLWEMLVQPLVEVVYEGIRDGWRRRKVRKMQAEVLPRYPMSLICPHCWHVARRS